MTKKTQDTTELERVVEAIGIATYGGRSFEATGVYKDKLEKIVTTYAKTVAEEAVREERKRIFQKYNVSRKESKKERAQGNAWNDLGNTLRNGV